MDSVSSFVRKFHNLKGSTIDEKRKKWLKSLHDLKFVKPPTVDLLVSSLTPKNHIESVFRIDLLIHFRRSVELLDTLKNGSEELSKKILKLPWFFHDSFENVSAKEIVNDFLPNLSFIMRKRVLKCLAKYLKDETKMDSIFDEVLERYGIETAMLTLSGCSIKKIENVFNTYSVKLCSKELARIFHKDPKLLMTYCQKNSLDGEKHDKIIKELIFRQPELYSDIRRFCKFVKLGKHSTKRLLQHNQKIIILNPSNFVEELNLKSVYNHLHRKDAITFLKNSFPRDVDSFNYKSIYDFLKYFPKKQQFQVLCVTYSLIYNQTIWINLEKLDDSLLELIPNPEEREKWIDIKVKPDETDKYLQYYETNKALSLIKTKINFCNDVKARCELVEKLVKVCKYTDDLIAVSEVIEYFHQRHRNDDKVVIAKFLDVLNSSFDLTGLENEHWKIIYAILETKTIQKVNFSAKKRIYLKYILYLWNNKQSTNKLFKELIMKDIISTSDTNLISNLGCEELEKYLLNIIIETIPVKYPKKEILNRDIDCIVWIIRWNTNHPERKEILLNRYPRLKDSLKSFIATKLNDKYNYSLKKILKYFMCVKASDDLSDYISHMYFEHGLEKYGSIRIVLWFLKKNPELLSQYSDKIIVLLCRKHKFNQNIWNCVKKLNNYNFCWKAIEYCKQDYTRVPASQQTLMLSILAFLLCPQDYVSFISNHIPADNVLDVTDQRQVNNFNSAKAVAKSLKYTKSTMVFPLLLRFCVGDYLKHTLDSLYYLFYHTPENKLDAILTELLSKSVSARKHAFFLISQVGSVHSVFNLLKSTGESEKNLSIKKHILNTTLKYFRRNPSDKIFELLKKCIPTLHITDTESLQSLIELNKIPSVYQTRFFQFTLEHLSALAGEDKKVSKFVDDFLSLVDDSLIKDLPPEYCSTFIQKYLFESQGYCFSDRAVEGFVIKFLFTCSKNLSEKLTMTFSKLILYKNAYEGDFKMKTKRYQRIYDFMILILKHLMNLNDLMILQMYCNLWLKFFSAEEFYDIYIILKLLLYKKEANNIIAYAQNVHSFLVEMTSKYDTYLVTCLAKNIKYLYQNLDSKDSDLLHTLCYELWQIDQSVLNCLLILEVLPNKPPRQDQNVQNYFRLLEFLEEHQDLSIKLLYNIFIKSVEF